MRTASLPEVCLNVFTDTGPVGRIDSVTDVSMERGVGPINDTLDVPMLNWIVVNIVDVSFEIVLIAYQVFPEPPLPKASLTSFLPRNVR